MQPFCFNPSTNRETLRDFNERVQEFCLETCALNVVAMASGKYLILKVFNADDADEEALPIGAPTVMPAVRMLDAKDGDWEEQLCALIEQEENKATEDDPVREVNDLVVLQNGHDSTKGWAIATVVTGDLEGDQLLPPGEEEEEEEEQAGEAQTPSPDLSSPSVGFQPNKG